MAPKVNEEEVKEGMKLINNGWESIKGFFSKSKNALESDKSLKSWMKLSDNLDKDFKNIKTGKADLAELKQLEDYQKQLKEAQTLSTISESEKLALKKAEEKVNKFIIENEININKLKSTQALKTTAGLDTELKNMSPKMTEILKKAGIITGVGAGTVIVWQNVAPFLDTAIDAQNKTDLATINKSYNDKEKVSYEDVQAQLQQQIKLLKESKEALEKGFPEDSSKYGTKENFATIISTKNSQIARIDEAIKEREAYAKILEKNKTTFTNLYPNEPGKKEEILKCISNELSLESNYPSFKNNNLLDESFLMTNKYSVDRLKEMNKKSGEKIKSQVDENLSMVGEFVKNIQEFGEKGIPQIIEFLLKLFENFKTLPDKLKKGIEDAKASKDTKDGKVPAPVKPATDPVLAVSPTATAAQSSKPAQDPVKDSKPKVP